MLMITVSNGRYLGGAFKIAPQATVLDGKLDACFFSDSNVVERARLFFGALRGTHLGMRAVSSAAVQELALTFAKPPSMEIDGELRTAKSTTVKLKCVPRALSVLAAPGARL
jgi:diacylglycerol kinase family enzyme